MIEIDNILAGSALATVINDSSFAEISKSEKTPLPKSTRVEERPSEPRKEEKKVKNKPQKRINN